MSIIKPTSDECRAWLNHLSNDDFYHLLFHLDEDVTKEVIGEILKKHFQLSIRARKSRTENRYITDRMEKFLIDVMNRDVLIRAAALHGFLDAIHFLPLRARYIPTIGFLDYYFHNLLTRDGMLAVDLRNMEVAHSRGQLQLSECNHEKLLEWNSKWNMDQKKKLRR